jgi:MFS transporter, DHA1 family, tetracycline resistance protein
MKLLRLLLARQWRMAGNDRRKTRMIDVPRRALATLFLIVFADLAGFGIVIPILPLYAERFHPAPWVFGLLMASYSAMQLVFAPVLGALSDRVGRRPVLLIALVGSVAGYLLFAVAHSLTLLFASRIIAGLAGANIATAQAVIADLTPPQRRAAGMGLIGAAFGLGFIAGPALASGLLLLGPAAPGLGAAACSAVAFGMTFFFLPESLPARQGTEGRGEGTGSVPAPEVKWGLARLAVARRCKGLRPLLGVGFLAVSGFAAFEVTFAQFLHGRIRLEDHKVTFMFVYIGVLAAGVQALLMGRLTRRFGERRLLVLGLLLTAAALASLAFQHVLAAVALLLPVLALGTGLTNPSLSSLISKSAGANEQGEALGAYQGVGSLARVAGPFLGELGLGHLGLGAPAAGAAALTALAATLAALALRQSEAGCGGLTSPMDPRPGLTPTVLGE